MSRKAPPVPENPVVRARNRAHEHLATAYDLGHRVITSTAWGKATFAAMRDAAPHVPEEALIRAFAGKTSAQEEFMVGHARFLEYNATAASTRPAPAASATSRREPAPSKAAAAARP